MGKHQFRVVPPYGDAREWAVVLSAHDVVELTFPPFTEPRVCLTCVPPPEPVRYRLLRLWLSARFADGYVLAQGRRMRPMARGCQCRGATEHGTYFRFLAQRV